MADKYCDVCKPGYGCEACRTLCPTFEDSENRGSCDKCKYDIDFGCKWYKGEEGNEPETI